MASSSSADWVRPWLDTFGLSDAFQAIWTRDRVREAKPSPELFLGAAAELGFPPGQCLVLEDSHNGLRAAQRLGGCCRLLQSFRRLEQPA